MQPLLLSVPETLQKTLPEVSPQHSEPPIGVANRSVPFQLDTTPFWSSEPLNDPTIGLIDAERDAALLALGDDWSSDRAHRRDRQPANEAIVHPGPFPE